MILYDSPHRQRQKLKQGLNSQKTAHLSLLRTSDGLSLVMILKEIDHAIMTPHSICRNAVQTMSQSKIMKTTCKTSHMHIYITILQKHMHICYRTQASVCTYVGTRIHSHKSTHMHTCILIHINTCCIRTHRVMARRRFFIMSFFQMPVITTLDQRHSSAVIAD